MDGKRERVSGREKGEDVCTLPYTGGVFEEDLQGNEAVGQLLEVVEKS